MSRTTTQKLTLFADCFSGLTNVYGTYDPATGKVWQVKAPVTSDVMLVHLQGRQPYGVYLLTGHVTRAVVADFDHEDREPLLAFHDAAVRHGLAVYIERSKRKGWHAWIFASPQGVSAHKTRSVVKMILTDIGHPKTEVFPKQDRLSGPNDYGNFINAPLFGKLVSAHRTVFVDREADFQPYADQWELLAGVQRVTESQLDEIIDRNDWGTTEGYTKPLVEAPAGEPISIALGLPPCARRILREGVADNQRVSCFQLAVDLKKAGLPEDMAVAALNVWSRKNRPTGHKQIISPQEIAAQTHGAYAKSDNGVGCGHGAVAPFCSENCPLYHTHSVPISPHIPAPPSPPSTSPMSATPPLSAVPASVPTAAP